MGEEVKRRLRRGGEKEWVRLRGVKGESGVGGDMYVSWSGGSNA